MNKLTSRTTVYLTPFVKKCIQYKAIDENRSLSTIVNDALTEIIKKEAGIEPAPYQKSRQQPKYDSWLKRAGMQNKKSTTRSM